MIFFTATACWVSWSLAELYHCIRTSFVGTGGEAYYQTRPNAPIPTGCRSVYLTASQLGVVALVPGSIFIPARDLESRAKDLGSHEFRHLEDVSSSSH